MYEGYEEGFFCPFCYGNNKWVKLEIAVENYQWAPGHFFPLMRCPECGKETLSGILKPIKEELSGEN